MESVQLLKEITLAGAKKMFGLIPYKKMLKQRESLLKTLALNVTLQRKNIIKQRIDIGLTKTSKPTTN